MTQEFTQDEWVSTHDWLVDALGGAVDGPTTPMLAQPNAAESNLLLPLATSAATAAALRRTHDDRTIGARLTTTAGRVAGRLGVLQRLGGERIEFPSTRVVKSIQTLFGDPSLLVSIGAGPPRRNRKPVLMLIRPGGEIAGFAKVGWSDFTTDLVVNEFNLLKQIDGRLPLPLLAPAPLELIEEGDNVIAVTSAIAASDWNRPRGLTPEQIDNIPRTFGHRWITAAEMGWLRHPCFGERADPSERRLENAVAGIAARFADEPLEVGLWHGDLNPWNLISNPNGVGVIDWEFGGPDRPVGQDRRHLRFEAIRRNGEIEPSAALAKFVERELEGPSTPAELGIYLADLSIRESQLSGQGWSSAMSGYRDPLARTIEDLLQ